MSVKPGDIVTWTTSTGTWTGLVRRVYSDAVAAVESGAVYHCHDCHRTYDDTYRPAATQPVRCHRCDGEMEKSVSIVPVSVRRLEVVKVS